jgi:hypothetical protein
MGATIRTETVAVLTEGGIEDRLQDLQYGLLDEPVQDSRNAELSLLAPGLSICCRRTGGGS